MRHLRAVRVATAVALVIPASLGIWTASSPASAAVAPPSCTALKGTETGKTDALTGCTPIANTGGSGTSATKMGKGTTGSSTITWASKHGVTTTSYNYVIVATAKEKCGKGNLEIIETGKVTKSSGLAAKVIKVGQKTTATVCLTTKTKGLSLLKGTKFVL
jgi:hypothetical protein